MSKNKKPKKVRRRKFLKYTGVGVGLMLGGIWLARNPLRRMLYEAGETMVPPYVGDTSPLVWFQVTPNNEVVLHSSKVEMGQGTFTSFAQIAADELDVDVNKIKVVHAATNTGNIDGMSTGGSLSVAGLYQPLREMAATMRVMLKNKAAEKLGVDASSLTTSNGVVSGGGKSMTYGEIVQGVEDWDIPDTPTLRDRSSYKYVGKPIPRVDLEAKVLGDPIFGIDATMEDMLYASVVRPRLVDASMENFDTSEAEKMPGVVQVIKEDGFVGVVANSYVEANNARKKIKFDYNKTKNWNLKDIEDYIKLPNGDKTIIQKEGSAILKMDEGELMEMEFKSPIGAHAQLEPNGAIASFKDGKVTVIMSTQVVSVTQKAIAKALGIKDEDVNLIPTFLGGGFGRRLTTPNAVQAALMSKAVGKPVKCFFDRKQEFQNDSFRPPTHHIMRGRVGEDGTLLGLEHNFSSGDVMINSTLSKALFPPGGTAMVRADLGAIRGGSIMYRDIENHRSVSHHRTLPFATSFWRSLGLLANTFAIESFIDEIALKYNLDPIAMRLKYLSDDKQGKRIAAVIKKCAENAGYSNTVSNGRAMGFAASVDAGSPCAQVVEASIENGKIKVHKVTAVMDCGIAVNPDQVKAQVEGCIIMGMSASLFEQMNLKENKLFPINYGSYQIAMMKDSPREINVELIEGDSVPGPVGEPPLGPIGAAIGNAVRRLTGQRLTELPMKLT
ncbi:MAG: molybdopterin cofactor-binding domain-containing protein [Bacteroidota bacterium]